MRHRGLRGARRSPSDRPRRSPPARISRVRLGGRRRARRRARRRQARRQARRARGRARGRGEPLRVRSAWVTRGGRPTARRPTATRTRIRTAAGASPSSTTASSRTSRRCAPGWRSRDTRWRPTPTRSASPTSSRSSCRRRTRRSPTRCARAVRELEGAYSLVVVFARRPRGARRRQGVLAVGGGDRRRRDAARLRHPRPCWTAPRP